MGGEETQEGGKGRGRGEVPKGVEEDDVGVRLLGGRDCREVVLRRVMDPADTGTEMRGGKLGLRLADCDGGA